MKHAVPVIRSWAAGLLAFVALAGLLVAGLATSAEGDKPASAPAPSPKAENRFNSWRRVIAVSFKGESGNPLVVPSANCFHGHALPAGPRWAPDPAPEGGAAGQTRLSRLGSP